MSNYERTERQGVILNIEKLRQIGQDDATVFTHIKMFDLGLYPDYATMLENLVEVLSFEKRRYFQQAVDVADRSVVPITVPLNDPRLRDLP